MSGDPWTYAGTATGDSELVNKEILIGGSQVTITAVASDGSTITTSPAPPSGTGLAFQVVTMCFRIQRWSLKKDWSVQIEAQTVTASMYDLDVGPKPMDVVPAPLPALFYPIPLGPVWAPYQVQASSSDALFPSEWTFDSDQEYTTLADGSALASLIVTGKLPVNEFSATGAGAPGIGSISQSTTGGSLPANITLWVAICAIDSNGLPSAPSNIAIIGTGTASGGSFTLDDIIWPAVAGLASYVLFVGTQPDLICAQATGTLTAGTGDTYTPSSITFGGPVVRSTWALPSPYVAKVRIKAKLLLHAGVAGIAVTTVSTNTLVCSELVDTSSTPFSPVGRILSVIGRPNGSTPFASFSITAFVPTTGTITLDRDPTGIVERGRRGGHSQPSVGPVEHAYRSHPSHRRRLPERREQLRRPGGKRGDRQPDSRDRGHRSRPAAEHDHGEHVDAVDLPAAAAHGRYVDMDRRSARLGFPSGFDQHRQREPADAR